MQDRCQGFVGVMGGAQGSVCRRGGGSVRKEVGRGVRKWGGVGGMFRA